MADVRTLSTIGTFTYAVAKLYQPGAVELDCSGAAVSVTDVWAFYLHPGERPGPTAGTGVVVPSGLPQKNARNPAWPALRLSGITLRNYAEQSGSVVWLAECAYGRTTTTASHSGGGGGGATTYTRIVERAWPIYESQEDLVVDAISGDAVLNAAGEPFDRVPQVKKRYVGARVKRAESEFPADALELDNTVNSDEVTILGITFPKHVARLEVSVEDTLAVGSEGRYVVTYDVVPAHNLVLPAAAGGDPADKGWDIPLVETGFNFLDGDGNLVRATIADSDGRETPTAQPVLLADDGTLLPDGDDPAVSVWSAYKEGDWSDLDLPSTPTAGDEDPTPPNSSSSSSTPTAG